MKTKCFFGLFLFLIASASINAQQWVGNVNSTDPIYRFGKVSINPTANMLPFLDLTNSNIRLGQWYNGSGGYTGTTLDIKNSEIKIWTNVPSGYPITTINAGKFDFSQYYTGGSQSSFFKYDNHIISTNALFNLKFSTQNILYLGSSNGGSLNGNAYLGFNALRNGTSWTFASNGTQNGGGVIYSTNNGNIIFSAVSSTGNSTQTITDNSIYSNATVRISPTTLYAKEIQVQTSVWADYVFNSNYRLRSLDEVEKFILKNKHLPDMPSEAEVLENGINVAQMNALLLQKIEELTLYMIELKKENELIKKELELKQ